ncbi:hypothetical protein LOAG_12024 [Loa loa]|uniref:Uncharacterized protein n=1 Tax=Loa loa TaxID=7209 RepID=A0A1S0TNI4_LOALO|nr:hypothetical protein LOAG_12024 [Loa loa]EFO16483.2 hypothetical protein LOAG_12024 [Loa loa]
MELHPQKPQAGQKHITTFERLSNNGILVMLSLVQNDFHHCIKGTAVPIEKDAVARSLSFDGTYTATKKYFERGSDLNSTPIIAQEMNDKTPVLISSEHIDFSLRQLPGKNSSISSELVNKKEVPFGEAASTELENYVDADKLQEVNTLRNINKILATKLAKAERIAQFLQIQLKFYDKTNDAKFACRLTDIIDQLKVLLPNDRFRDEALKVLNSANPSIDVNDEKFAFLNSLLEEIECDKTVLSNSGTLRKYCERLVEYARKHPPVLMELQNQINEEKNNAEIIGLSSHNRCKPF